MSDWNPALYMHFAAERLHPATELLARIPLENVWQIADIGCGPGNSTALLYLRKPRKIAMATPIILNGARVNLIPRCVYQGSIIRTAIEKRKFSSKRENILDNTEPCQTKIRRSQCCCGRTIMVIFKHGTFALLNVITITFSRCLPTNFL